MLDGQPIPTENRILAVTTDEGTVLIPAGVGNEFTYAELEIPHEAFPKRLVIEGPAGFELMFRDRAAYQDCVNRHAKALADRIDAEIMAQYLKGNQ